MALDPKACPPGGEQWESFTSKVTGCIHVQYDYRTADGDLFSTVARDLETCRRLRDEWLSRCAASRKGAAG